MQGNNHESITLFDLVISYKNNRNWFTCITSFDYTITKLVNMILYRYSHDGY